MLGSCMILSLRLIVTWLPVSKEMNPLREPSGTETNLYVVEFLELQGNNQYSELHVVSKPRGFRMVAWMTGAEVSRTFI